VAPRGSGSLPGGSHGLQGGSQVLPGTAGWLPGGSQEPQEPPRWFPGAPGSHLGANRGPLGSTWEPPGSLWKPPGRLLSPPGSHLRTILEPSGSLRTLEVVQGAGRQGRPGDSKLIQTRVCVWESFCAKFFIIFRLVLMYKNSPK
jgi:hypothetical protein